MTSIRHPANRTCQQAAPASHRPIVRIDKCSGDPDISPYPPWLRTRDTFRASGPGKLALNWSIPVQTECSDCRIHQSDILPGRCAFDDYFMPGPPPRNRIWKVFLVFRPYGRQTRHYTCFGITSGWPVTRPSPMNRAVVHSATLGKLRGGDPTLY
jgi:hypothetical protein